MAVLLPWVDLANAIGLEVAEAITGGLVVPTGQVQVYPTPTEQIVPPAIVLGPDNPWVSRSEFCTFGEHRYLAAVMVAAGDTTDGTALLFELTEAVRRSPVRCVDGQGGWTETNSPRLSDLGGSPHLVADVRLTYHR